MRKLITEGWDELKIPDELCEIELNYEDLGVPVEEETVEYTNTYGPMNDYGDTGEVDGVRHGTVNNWTITVEPTEDDFKDFVYGKQPCDGLTQDDIDYVAANIDDFEDFLMSRYEDDAIEEAEANYDPDDVDWDDDSEPGYYDYEFEPAELDEKIAKKPNSGLMEVKKKKKQSAPYTNCTFTTGDPDLNIKHFNKMAGTDFEDIADKAQNSAEGESNSEPASQVSTLTTDEVTGESMLESKIFSKKANLYFEVPDRVIPLQEKEVSEFIAKLPPQETFKVGYITPIYFYKKLLDKFSLLKCTEMTGYTGVDYWDTKAGVVSTDSATAKDSQAQIDDPEGMTKYNGKARSHDGTGMDYANNAVKSHIAGMRKDYAQINKTVKQADGQIYLYDEKGRIARDESGNPIITETIPDLKTILFYPQTGSTPKVKYYIDLNDGNGYWEISRDLLVDKIYNKVVEITERDWHKGEISGVEDMTDDEVRFLNNVTNKVQRILDGDAATIEDVVLANGSDASRPAVRALYTNQIYYLEGNGETLGDSLMENYKPEAGEKLTEAKRYVRRYYIRPQDIFCSNKTDIIKALIELDNANCTIYTLNNLGDEKDVTKLTNNDIIYYYDDGILYDKNHVRVMDYDLYIKHEENRDKINTNTVSDAKFSDIYDDRLTDADLKNNGDDIKRNGTNTATVAEGLSLEIDEPIELSSEDEEEIYKQDFPDVNVYGETLNKKLKEDKEEVCCICGEPLEGYGNNAEPYKKGRCCDACNMKFVIPARLERLDKEENKDKE